MWSVLHKCLIIPETFFTNPPALSSLLGMVLYQMMSCPAHGYPALGPVQQLSYTAVLVMDFRRLEATKNMALRIRFQERTAQLGVQLQFLSTFS